MIARPSTSTKPIAVLTNADGQVGLCGPQYWCLASPTKATWRDTGDGIEILLDGKSSGLAPPDALQDLASAHQIILMSFNGSTRIHEHGSVPFERFQAAERPGL